MKQVDQEQPKENGRAKDIKDKHKASMFMAGANSGITARGGKN